MVLADLALADAAGAQDGGDDGAGGDAGSDAGSNVQMLGPIPYLKRADSPWFGQTFAYQYLEDVEDGLLNTPGLSADSGKLASGFGPALIDSVDEDDGDASDGVCKKATGTCDSWWAGGAVTLKFDGAALGGLPTHVGVVWTDGSGVVTFTAYDKDGAVLGVVGPVSDTGFPDGNFMGGTAEDRFFGVIAPGGVGSIKMQNGGAVEVDHIQYARAM
jgi:hypothetical protein